MKAPGWEVRETRHGRFTQVPALLRHGLIHGFSCRELGSRLAPPDPGVALAEGLGLRKLRRVRLRQRHTGTAHQVTPAMAAADPLVGDGLVANRPGWALSLQTADCLPVLLLDPRGNGYAAAHAGWRGTLAGILAATLRQLRLGGARLDEVWIAVGPAIRACCFEVGPEVSEAFEERWPEARAWMRHGSRGGAHLDLVAANRFQAEKLGVRPERFLDPGWCTRCRTDLFFSYRGDGPETGRIVTLAARLPVSTAGP
jgi:purine-nucleoside/S-methyl-5'-thioadenosine phosphorylase / adenosine deaminase